MVGLAGCGMGQKIEAGCGIREILRAGYGMKISRRNRNVLISIGGIHLHILLSTSPLEAFQ